MQVQPPCHQTRCYLYHITNVLYCCICSIVYVVLVVIEGLMSNSSALMSSFFNKRHYYQYSVLDTLCMFCFFEEYKQYPAYKPLMIDSCFTQAHTSSSVETLRTAIRISVLSDYLLIFTQQTANVYCKAFREKNPALVESQIMHVPGCMHLRAQSFIHIQSNPGMVLPFSLTHHKSRY